MAKKALKRPTLVNFQEMLVQIQFLAQNFVLALAKIIKKLCFLKRFRCINIPWKVFKVLLAVLY